MASQHDSGSSLGERFVDMYQRRNEPSDRPRRRHTQSIGAVRHRAYYAVLNGNPSFTAALQELFTDWSWQAAEQLVKAWRLPDVALKDLVWSRDVVRLSGGAAPSLFVGYRSYPGIETDATRADVRRLGYAALPNQDFDSKTYERSARRLYARVVEERPWREVAAIDRNAPVRAYDTKFVRRRVTEFANDTGVPLPMRRPGRPRVSRAG